MQYMCTDCCFRLRQTRTCATVEKSVGGCRALKFSKKKLIFFYPLFFGGGEANDSVGLYASTIKHTHTQKTNFFSLLLTQVRSSSSSSSSLIDDNRNRNRMKNR